MTPRSILPGERRLGDAIAGGLVGALGVYVVLTASGWTLLDVDGPGPGFFPLIYGIGMVVGSLALAVGGLRRRPAPEPQRADSAGTYRALGLWAAFVLMVVLMEFVGFAVAFGLVIVFFCRAIFHRSPAFTLASAVLAPIGFHLVFSTLLGVHLPVGRLTGF
jgi:putative tricarboxylic transport membrane protein